MQPRVSSLGFFRENLKHNLKLFIEMIRSGNGKIYLVTSDAVCTRQTVRNIMTVYISNCKEINVDTLKDFGDLSACIYSCIYQGIEGALILDFANVYVGGTVLEKSNLHLLEEINANRDIFLEHFSNTVIILSSSMSYWFQSMARDIYSCVSLHLDMTNWFIIPEDLPIFHINFPYSGSNKGLIDNGDLKEISKYTSLKQRILSLKRFELNLINSLKEDIDSGNRVYRSELLCLLLKKVATVPASANAIPIRKQIIYTWDCSGMNYISLVQSHCYMGEFWYINGEFPDAERHFKEAISIMDSALRQDETNYSQWGAYLYFLICNKIISRVQYASSGNFGLLNLIKQILNEAQTENDDILVKFYAESYLFIYNVCLGNCNYVTLLDLYEQEKSHMDDRSYASVNIYKNMLLWVQYIVTDKFVLPNSLEVFNPWTYLHITLMTMIHSFRIGSYKDATHFYKKAQDRIRELGHVQMRAIAKSIRENMLFLQKLEASSQSIDTLLRFLFEK